MFEKLIKSDAFYIVAFIIALLFLYTMMVTTA